MIKWTQTDFQLNENSGTVTLVADRLEGSNGDIRVSYQVVSDTATAGEAFEAAQGTLEWLSVDREPKTVSITIIKDLLQEETEQFRVELSQPLGGATIADRSAVTLTIGDIRDPQAPDVDAGADIEVMDFDGDGDGDGDGEIEVNFDTSNTTSWNSKINKVEWIFEGEVVATGIKTKAVLPVGENQLTVRVTNNASLVSEKLLNVLETAQRSKPTGTLASTPGIDSNKRSLAETLDNLRPRLQLSPLTGGQSNLLPRCNGLLNPDLSNEDQAAALQAIAGEEEAALLSAATDFASVQQNNICTRLTKLRRGDGGIDLSGLNIRTDSGTLNEKLIASAFGDKLGGAASGDEYTYLLESSRWGVFLNGNILYGDTDKADNQNGYDLDVNGLNFGMDYRITDSTVACLAIGFADIDLDYKQNGGTMDSESQFITA